MRKRRLKGKRYVYKRGKRWWMGFTHPNTGKETQLSTGVSASLPEAKARKVLTELVARIEAGTAFGEELVGTMTVREFADAWINERKEAGVSTWKDDKARLDNHILSEIGDVPLQEVRPRGVRAIVKKLKKTALAPRTVRNIYGTARTMFNDAVAEELIEVSPCKLRRGDLPKKKDKDPTWRATAVFNRDELVMLVSSPEIPFDRRVFYALLGLTGARFGEVSALRWRALDMAFDPLGRLLVSESFNTDKGIVKPLKTDNPRQVPVHPLLAAILASWATHGWPVIGGAAPTPDDLIVPSRRMRHRSRHHMLTKLHEDLERIGLRRRRLHDLRRTFISLARADGARKDLLEVITHGPRGNIVDVYTEFPWAFLCVEVAKLTLGVDMSAYPPPPALPAVMQRPGVSLQSGLHSHRKCAKLPEGKDFSWWRRRESNPWRSLFINPSGTRIYPLSARNRSEISLGIARDFS